jgi:hypothetical protein
MQAWLRCDGPGRGTLDGSGLSFNWEGGIGEPGLMSRVARLLPVKHPARTADAGKKTPIPRGMCGES